MVHWIISYASITHFWKADLGDDHKWPYYSWNVPNAYTKAKAYINGDWWLANKMVDLYLGKGQIVFPRIKYNNLFEVYHGRGFKKVKIYSLLGQDLTEKFYNKVKESTTLHSNIFWENIGRIAHLLQDMTLPCHAHNDPHPSIPLLFIKDGDSFHNLIDKSTYKNFTAEDAYREGGMIRDINNKKNPLRYLFYTANQIADFYPSYDEKGDKDAPGNKTYNPNFQGDYYKELDDFYKNYVGNREPINSYTELKNKYPEMERKLYTLSIRLTASFMYWVAKKIGDTEIPFLQEVNIQGPRALNFKEYGDYSVGHYGGSGSTSYEWKKKDSDTNTWSNILTTSRTFRVQMRLIPVDIQVKFTKGKESAIKIIRVNNSRKEPDDPYGPKIIKLEHELSQNYPNPFNPETSIDYSINENGHVRIIIFNNLGQFVKTLVNEYKVAGSYNTKWNASKFASGVYYYKLITPKKIITKKMILFK